MDTSTTLEELPISKNMKHHYWTDEEKVFKRKERIMLEIESLNISLRSALLYKLSKSVFGPFMQELNTEQQQDYILNDNKLQILNWHLKRYNNHDMNIIKERNRFLYSYYELLLKAVNGCDVIDLSYLRDNLESLYLDCCFIKRIDETLQRFNRIRMLTLCGNYIRDLSGALLPRTLVFLELFDNFISNLSNLVKHSPKSIIYLGLGRNRLKDGSKLHLLAKSNNFARLKCIDLSDNDICDGQAALKKIQTLSSLTAISLEGNPCSVTPDYKSNILQQFPRLHYLDATEILTEDRVPKPLKREVFSKRIINPQIILQCYRILGLPEPPKDKKNIQTIHIEFFLPLLVENPITDPEEESKDIHQLSQEKLEENNNKASKQKNEKRKDKNQKSKDKKEKAGKAEKHEDSKKKKKKSYYARDNEYNEKLEKNNVWFKTEKVQWSKIIQFPPVQVNNVEISSTKIRDTFRSIVPVRIVYLKIAPYEVKKKKHSIKDKKIKGDKKSTRMASQDNMSHNETVESIKEEHVDIILKKVTLACFYCELKSINWSDEALDFYWVDHPDMGERALRVNGSLQALEYDLDATPKKLKANIPKDANEMHIKESLPNILTCQVGFGVNRS